MNRDGGDTWCANYAMFPSSPDWLLHLPRGNSCSVAQEGFSSQFQSI